jgi:hypothetical protein
MCPIAVYPAGGGRGGGGQLHAKAGFDCCGTLSISCSRLWSPLPPLSP